MMMVCLFKSGTPGQPSRGRMACVFPQKCSKPRATAGACWDGSRRGHFGSATANRLDPINLVERE